MVGAVYVRWLNKMSPSTSSASAVGRRGSEVELTPVVVIVAVVFMCLILLGLYFFYTYLGTSQHLCFFQQYLSKYILCPFI